MSSTTLSDVIHSASLGDKTYRIRKLAETWTAIDSDEPAGRSSYVVEANHSEFGFLGEVARFATFLDARDWVDGKVGYNSDAVAG